MENNNKIYTIDLGNGTILTDLTMNGNNFVSETPIEEEAFDGMGTVIISNGEDNFDETIEHAELVALSHQPDGGYYFVLRGMSAEELKQASNDAQILFTAIATDTLLEN